MSMLKLKVNKTMTVKAINMIVNGLGCGEITHELYHDSPWSGFCTIGNCLPPKTDMCDKHSSLLKYAFKGGCFEFMGLVKTYPEESLQYFKETKASDYRSLVGQKRILSGYVSLINELRFDINMFSEAKNESNQ